MKISLDDPQVRKYCGDRIYRIVWDIVQNINQANIDLERQDKYNTWKKNWATDKTSVVKEVKKFSGLGLAETLLLCELTFNK